MNYKILAADDEYELLEVLELFLIKEDLTLIKAKDGIEAMEAFGKHDPQMVLLDVMMPGLDGFSVLRRIREVSRIPAIMLTARGEDYDKILGLELGADDYITKPYNPLEVVARIKAQLRRSYDYREIKVQQNRELRAFDLVLAVEEGILKKAEKEVPLTRTEFRILEFLMRTPGRIYTKQQIFDYAWQDAYEGGNMVDDNTLMVHISNLRSKIGDDAKNPKIIKTVKGLGYRFEKEARDEEKK